VSLRDHAQRVYDRLHSDGGDSDPATICTVCQQPIEGEPVHHGGEPAHGDCKLQLLRAAKVVRQQGGDGR
jgi:hypothetical protein